MKFKKGDKVRVLDGSNIRDYRNCYVSDMKNYVGKVYTIGGMAKHIKRHIKRFGHTLTYSKEVQR